MKGPSRAYETDGFPSISQRGSKVGEKSIWKHGAVLKQKYHDFEVDESLVERHLPVMKEVDSKVEHLLNSNAENACHWQTLFTHPKLMSNYYWKDKRIHSKDQRLTELKHVLKLQTPYAKNSPRSFFGGIPMNLLGQKDSVMTREGTAQPKGRTPFLKPISSSVLEE